MNRWTRGFAPLLLAAALGACAGQSSNPAEGPRREEAGARLVVRNSNWADAAVYIQASGTMTRLGEVTSMNTRSFRIPARALYNTRGVQLWVDLLGTSRRYPIDAVDIPPGVTAELTIENQISLSRLVLR